MPLVPSYREKLLRVPLDLDHPYWVNDPDFDLEFHVRHIALPKPGDWRQLCIQAARLQARALDLDRPLWEFYVIEGLDNVDGVPRGSFAILSKVHHAAIDGVSGAEMTAVIHDATPDPEEVVAVDEYRAERVPNAVELLGRASLNNAAQPVRFARLARRTMRVDARQHRRAALEPCRRRRGRGSAGRSRRIASSMAAASRWRRCARSRPQCRAPRSTTPWSPS